MTHDHCSMRTFKDNCETIFRSSEQTYLRWLWSHCACTFHFQNSIWFRHCFILLLVLKHRFGGQLKISLTQVNIDSNNWETVTANRGRTSVGPSGVYVCVKGGGLKFESNRQHEEDSWRAVKRDQLFQSRSTLISFWYPCSRLFRISLVFHNHFHHLSQKKRMMIAMLRWAPVPTSWYYFFSF